MTFEPLINLALVLGAAVLAEGKAMKWYQSTST